MKKFLFILIVLISVINIWGDEKKIKISIDDFPPFSQNSKTEPRGFDIDLINLIAVENGWNIEWVARKTVTDVISAVEKGEADAGISGITITSSREETMDFTHAYFESGLQILISSRNSGTFDVVKGLKSAFPVILKNIIALIIFLTITAHVIWIIERKNKSEEHFSENYIKGIGQGYWWSIVTMTTVGYGDIVPKLKYGRIIAALIMIAGIMWFSVFTASLGAAITTNFFSSEISSIKDLEGKIVGTKNGSIAFETLKNIPGARVVVYDDIEKACKDTAEGVISATVFDMPALAAYAKKDRRVMLTGKMFNKQQYGIALKTNSPLREIINKTLLKFKEGKEYSTLYGKWFGEYETGI